MGFLRLDLFPAKVEVNGEIIPKDARFLATDDTIYVYVDAPGGPKVEFQGKLEDFSGRATTGWTAVLDGETIVKVSRASGCACGSRLRGFIPDEIRGLPYQAQ